MPPRKGTSPKPKDAQAYRHPDADSPARPEIRAFELPMKPMRFQGVDTVQGGLTCANSVPVLAGDRGQIAVTVINPHGNELVMVRKLGEGK